MLLTSRRPENRTAARMILGPPASLTFATPAPPHLSFRPSSNTWNTGTADGPIRVMLTAKSAFQGMPHAQKEVPDGPLKVEIADASVARVSSTRFLYGLVNTQPAIAPE
jgi:hypothetical protein